MTSCPTGATPSKRGPKVKTNKRGTQRTPGCWDSTGSKWPKATAEKNAHRRKRTKRQNDQNCANDWPCDSLV